MPSGHHPVVQRLHRLPRSFSLLEINRRFQTPHGSAGPIALYVRIWGRAAASGAPAISHEGFAEALPGFVKGISSQFLEAAANFLQVSIGNHTLVTSNDEHDADGRKHRVTTKE